MRRCLFSGCARRRPRASLASHYYAGGQRIAQRVLTTATSAGVLYYLHGDHPSTSLRTGPGSTSLVTCGTAGACGALGAVVSRQLYHPYGTVRYVSGAVTTDYGFQGQRLDDTGLVHMGARYYDPTLGRWSSPDSIVPSQFNPQSLNRYSFVRNNPLRYTDPTGHLESPCGQFEQECSGTISPTDPPSGGSNPPTSGSNPPSTPPAPPSPPKSPNQSAGLPQIEQWADYVYVVTMPPGWPTYVTRSQREKLAGKLFAWVGLAIDFGELAALVGARGFVADFWAMADVGVTFTACALAGECFTSGAGTLHSTLPPMAVFNQDAIWSVGDLVLGFTGRAAGFGIGLAVGARSGESVVAWRTATDGARVGAFVDFLTTSGSIGYDAMRAAGALPNRVSVGFSLAPGREGLYIIIWPEP
jgi:RHS repeat-associated protein